MPADFGENELIWTLTSPNGQTKKAYASLHPDYFIDDVILQRNSGAPTADWLLTNEAPRLEVQGEATRTVAVGEPLTLTAVATDDGVPEWFRLPPRPTHVTTFGARGLRVAWFVYRGAGTETTFEPEQFQVWEDRRVGADSPWGPGWGAPPLPPNDTWEVRATFNEPGTYVVRCLAHDGGPHGSQGHHRRRQRPARNRSPIGRDVSHAGCSLYCRWG